MTRNWLADIVANKRQELEAFRALRSLAALRAEAEATEHPPHFIEALTSSPMGLIAEVKRKSPSAGIIREPFDPVSIARDYEAAGAQAVSVLMDRDYFGGGEEHFAAVRQSISLPLLYKEFVVDEWQVWHGATLGASAVLLIVAALEQRALKSLIATCREAGVTPLVEVHDVDEFRIATDCGGDCIGINNRNLKTFETTLETTFEVAQAATPGTFLISESGIRTSDDVMRLKEGGARAVLVGEQLLRQKDLEAAVLDLMGVAWACS